MQRLTISLSLILLIGLTGMTVNFGAAPETTKQAAIGEVTTVAEDHVDAPLIVHEWGTFTSFSGSDGVKLEFRPLVDNDLPKFVAQLLPWSGSNSNFPIAVFLKPSIRSIQRMETPVTYFYTPIERDVEVKVEFPKGLLTEYYPPVQDFLPKFDWSKFTPTDANKTEPVPVENGLLDWGKIHLIPSESLHAQVEDEELARRIGRHVEALMVEPAAGFPHYYEARNTDSAIIQKRTGTVPAITDYFEKFLFYRGVGNFELPITLTHTQEEFYELTNRGESAVRSLFLVSVQGENIRFRQYDSIAADSTLQLEQTDQVGNLDALANAMVAALVNEGLYEKEAKAMVACWKSSWFGEEGTRLLYMVPTPVTNELLPLHVSPTPDEVVRVLVGRMELMPKSQEEKILELVASSSNAREDSDGNAEFRSPSLEEIRNWGRMAEPALVRAQNITKDGRLRAEAAQLIWELRGKSK